MAERAEPREMRWWGWGDPAQPPALPAHALRFLHETVGVAERPRPPVALGRVRLGDTALGSATMAELRAILGRDGVREDHRIRVLHAAGKGYPDLVRLRAGEPEAAPDAVLYPADHAQLRAVLEFCARTSIAVVPFGGGTSVVGGVAPLRGEHAGVVSLDMGRMGSVLSLDRESATVTVEAGIRAPALEAQLGARGLTLGHYPQSYRVRLAGWLCGHALGGTGIDGLRGDREDGPRPAPGGSGAGDRPARDARDRGRPRAAGSC